MIKRRQKVLTVTRARKGQKKPLSPKEAGKTTTLKEIDKTIE